MLRDIATDNGANCSAHKGHEAYNRHGSSPAPNGKHIADDAIVQTGGCGSSCQETKSHDHTDTVTEASDDGENDEKHIEEVIDGQSADSF